MKLELLLGSMKLLAQDAARQERPVALRGGLASGAALAPERRLESIFVLALHADILVERSVESPVGSNRRRRGGGTGGRPSRSDQAAPEPRLVAVAGAAAPAAPAPVLGLVHPNASAPELAPVESADGVVGCA